MNTEKRVFAWFGAKQSVEEIKILQSLFEKDIEMNIFMLPQKEYKDTVIQINSTYIHQYAIHGDNMRMDEILRDMIALHADTYILSPTTYTEEVKHILQQYGFHIEIMKA